MAEHTPSGLVVGRTFRTHNHPSRFWETDIDDDLSRIIATTSGETQKEAEANAALIVRAVNSHDALVKALETLLAEAENFSVSGVYFSEECMGHKGPTLARAALALSEQD